MSRYSNQGSPSKPVDYYRPLTVDVSVEYELPKEVAPPKGSAPLLIIHPSAYFRSKHHHQPSTSNISQSRTAPPKAGHASGRTSSARLGDIASTLYYLSTGAGLVSSPTQQQQHIKTRSSQAKQHVSSSAFRAESPTMTRYRNQALGNAPGSASMRCAYGNCNECSANSSSVPIKKSHQNLPDRTSYGRMVQQMSGNTGSIPMNNSARRSTLFATHDGGISGFGNSVITPNQNDPMMASSGNKRLRMMSHQQQQQTLQQSAITNRNKPPLQLMEPLNLAITPSTANSLNPSYHNQFSVFLGCGLPNSNGSPVPTHGTLPNNSNAPKSYFAAQSTRPSNSNSMDAVPVNKGSGSDSGVCSENESDVSPGMTLPDHQQRRLTLSKDLSSSGCYCCCCPITANSASSRKSSSTSQSQSAGTGSWSSASCKGSRSGKPPQVTLAGPRVTSRSGSRMTNYDYDTYISNVLQHHHEPQSSAEPAIPMLLGNSALGLDSEAGIHQQRKWFNFSGIDSVPGITMNTLNNSSVGRWFQV